MSTWAAFAVKGAAVVGTGSAGAGITRAIAPGALDGFAVGTLLTGMCFLVIVAPRSLRRARLAARPSLWAASIWRHRTRPDYYAAPADTHSPAAEPADLAAPVVVAPPAGEADVVPATEESSAPELPLDFADPALEMLAPPAGREDALHAGADPYAPETFAADPHPASPFAPDPFAPDPLAPNFFAEDPDAPDPYAAAEAFGNSDDDDGIVLPDRDDAQPESRRGYHSKHRMTAPDISGRRPEVKRRQPRHAAPSARLGTRMSGKLASLPLVPVRG
jgi:hypothetical protein